MRLPHPRSEEAELIRELRAGEERAFTEIVRRYRPRLLAFARRLLAGRSENAEDVVQEALMRAHRALRRDAREMHLGPWLFVLTRNCCLDELSRLRSDTVALEESGGEQSLVDRRSPDVVAEGRVGLREMLDGIATLPIEQRHALVRREVDGASYAQIADELGVSSQATRALVHRARHSLVAYRKAAATDVCITVQADLLKAHRTGRRAAHASHRHLVLCSDCRAYRTRLKALRRSLHAMHPGPAIALAASVIKLGPIAGKLSGFAGGTAASAKTAAGTAGVLAVLSAAALGGTLVLGAGAPSPMTIKSPAVPGGTLRAGTPLPAGTAIVATRVHLQRGRATVELACPTGQRVADLLPPGDPDVTAGYAGETNPGASASAHVVLLGSQPGGGGVAVAILCRRPQSDGALVPLKGAISARASQLALACVDHAFLLNRPGGRPSGSVSLAQPLLTLTHRGAWERVRTQFHETGWLPQSATCAGPHVPALK
ncbi:MAG TPA: sigma-70 family RNA polymerase sigma factor [Solirubrobacteraceae bacterium]|jgi:RNA polymerase sigma factor (sigma-70 family)